MPELPEVQTMVNDLEKKVLQRTFLDIWTDAPKIVRYPETISEFKQLLKGEKITRISRYGKVIIFYLSGEKKLLVHPKMTGHFLVGHWQYRSGNWLPKLEKQYIHLMFWLDNELMLAWSDQRKFSRLELRSMGEDLEEIKMTENIGLDALSPELTSARFWGLIRKQRRQIKIVLMDQSIIAGIGNIYASEILWKARIYPGAKASSLKKNQGMDIYKAMRSILVQAVRRKGTTVGEFRDTENKPGQYSPMLKAYHRQGEHCFRCQTLIKRIIINGRATFYCPKCQKPLKSKNDFLSLW